MLNDFPRLHEIFILAISFSWVYFKEKIQFGSFSATEMAANNEKRFLVFISLILWYLSTLQSRFSDIKSDTLRFSDYVCTSRNVWCNKNDSKHNSVLQQTWIKKRQFSLFTA